MTPSLGENDQGALHKVELRGTRVEQLVFDLFVSKLFASRTGVFWEMRGRGGTRLLAASRFDSE